MPKQSVSKIVVNASALRSGGALSILQQFVKEVPDDGHEYLIFVDESVKLEYTQDNIQIVPVNVISFRKRFAWDAFGLKKWLKEHNIFPLLSISLQNTNFRLDTSCPNYIYYHQPLPIYMNNWNLLRKEERILWIYKHIYPFFVNMFIRSNTEIFVQLEFIKKGFAHRYHFSKDSIHVVFPSVEIPLSQTELNIDLDGNTVKIFYPAAALVYKNHQVLFEALAQIDSRLNSKVILYLTNSANEFEIKQAYKNVQIVFLGKINHEEVIWLFNHVDALVFPSYIETLGLPLIEAASFGLPVIASDLPYAREVLHGYEGVTFVDYNDAASWGMKMLDLYMLKGKRYKSFIREDVKSWKYFFEVIKKSL